MFNHCTQFITAFVTVDSIENEIIELKIGRIHRVELFGDEMKNRKGDELEAIVK